MRLFIDVFFIVMGMAVNGVLACTARRTRSWGSAPTRRCSACTSGCSPWWRRAPPVLRLLAGEEFTLGVLMLGSGRWDPLGRIGGIVFLLGITPVGLWTLPNPNLALGMGCLLTRPPDRSVVDMVRLRQATH
ncbi:hypothetical protein NGF75_08330 [Dietzia kunjamensis]|uniref:hypothetical protein n=1 Tax=Dietzia kunjamensis TaxID=322509 RepID=UPI002DBE2E56|nr:hypothetical protein [Dietzia kunjamensis]MEB8325993.1 hypothetical protein [Dietzia kunjamensis]